MIVPFVFLRKMRGHLGQRLGRRNTDTDRHCSGFEDTFAQLFTPGFEVQMFHTFQETEGFVYAVTVELRRGLFDDFHYPRGDFGVQFVVGRERHNLVFGKPLA